MYRCSHTRCIKLTNTIRYAERSFPRQRKRNWKGKSARTEIQFCVCETCDSYNVMPPLSFPPSYFVAKFFLTEHSIVTQYQHIFETKVWPKWKHSHDSAHQPARPPTEGTKWRGGKRRNTTKGYVLTILTISLLMCDESAFIHCGPSITYAFLHAIQIPSPFMHVICN